MRHARRLAALILASSVAASAEPSRAPRSSQPGPSAAYNAWSAVGAMRYETGSAQWMARAAHVTLEEIQAMREEGLSWKSVARSLGVSSTGSSRFHDGRRHAPARGAVRTPSSPRSHAARTFSIGGGQLRSKRR